MGKKKRLNNSGCFTEKVMFAWKCLAQLSMSQFAGSLANGDFPLREDQLFEWDDQTVAPRRDPVNGVLPVEGGAGTPIILKDGVVRLEKPYGSTRVLWK